MSHGDATMKREIACLLTADTNQEYSPVIPEAKKLPYWCDFFEYYVVDGHAEFKERDPASDDHHLQKTGEVTMADQRMRRHRMQKGAKTRLLQGRDPIELKLEDVEKEPRQGQFDNVHMAPRMHIRFKQDGQDVHLDDIVMAPFCLHDCLHLHTRWSTAQKGKAVCGFDGFTPNATPGAPSVPENQTVFLSFPNKHTIRYRAVAEAPKQGNWQVFCHHGLAYAIDAWPGTDEIPFTGPTLLGAIKTVIEANAQSIDEPFDDMPDDGQGWARLYWRLRFGGKDDRIVERLTFDLTKCLK